MVGPLSSVSSRNYNEQVSASEAVQIAGARKKTVALSLCGLEGVHSGLGTAARHSLARPAKAQGDEVWEEGSKETLRVCCSPKLEGSEQPVFIWLMSLWVYWMVLLGSHIRGHLWIWVGGSVLPLTVHRPAQTCSPGDGRGARKGKRANVCFLLGHVG